MYTNVNAKYMYDKRVHILSPSCTYNTRSHSATTHCSQRTWEVKLNPFLSSSLLIVNWDDGDFSDTYTLMMCTVNTTTTRSGDTVGSGKANANERPSVIIHVVIIVVVWETITSRSFECNDPLLKSWCVTIYLETIPQISNNESGGILSKILLHHS